MKRLCAAVLTLLFISTFTPVNAADTISITSSSAYTATIDSVGAIWKGNIPTKISFPAGTYSQKLEFQIQGILPYSVLADRATGTQVEFELWSEQGKKVAYDTVYESDWNPVGPNTLVSMYLNESDAVGNPTLIVRTIYELSTTGLLTRYLKSEQRFQVSIISAKKPATVDVTAASYETDGLTWSFSALSDPSVTTYELGMKFIKSPGLDPTVVANYGDFIPVTSATAPKTILKFTEVKKLIAPYISDFSNSAVGVAVRAKNGGMSGDWGKWFYFETKYISAYEAKLIQDAAKADQEKNDRINRCSVTNTGISDLLKLTDFYIAKYPSNAIFSNLKSQIPTPLDCSNAADVSMSLPISNQDSKLSWIDSQLKSAMNLADFPPSASAKKATITCVKGTMKKTITAVNPKCPAGYKKK